jgi:tRNA modification GTPase
MSTTQVAVLTPPGSAAIAVFRVRGPAAWEIVRRYFQPARGQLADVPPAPSLRFGRFGDAVSDEVMLVTREKDCFEIHCHGGRRVVEWLLGLMKTAGAEETAWPEVVTPEFADPRAGALLPFARTVRTAAILLDQAHGAYERAIAANDNDVLRRNATVGRHLVEPWTVAIAGPPNAGKSTLLNALAGFSRSVVSPIPGTTRDAVSVSLAFDGWPIDLIDTAGLRETLDAVEIEGVERARQAVAASDLCLWVIDANLPLPASADDITRQLGRVFGSTLIVLNKSELTAVPVRILPDAIRISAATGQGLTELAKRIVQMLIPVAPKLGEPVPYTPELCRFCEGG